MEIRASSDDLVRVPRVIDSTLYLNHPVSISRNLYGWGIFYKVSEKSLVHSGLFFMLSLRPCDADINLNCQI